MLRLNKSEQPVTNAVEELSNRDVAVIGISLQMPLADQSDSCLLYTSDAADELLCVHLGGMRIL